MDIEATSYRFEGFTSIYSSNKIDLGYPLDGLSAIKLELEQTY